MWAEFDFRVIGDGRSATARYANNSNYRNDSLIRKEMSLSALMISEIKKIIKESEVMKEDDSKWPQKNKDGRQELEIRLGSDHIQFETAKIGSLVDVNDSADPEGLRVFYYLVQDLKALVFSLISLHFKIKPIWRIHPQIDHTMVSTTSAELKTKTAEEVRPVMDVEHWISLVGRFFRVSAPNLVDKAENTGYSSTRSQMTKISTADCLHG